MFNKELTCKASARLGVGAGALLVVSCVILEVAGASILFLTLMSISIILSIPSLAAGITNRREAGDEMYDKNMGRASQEAGFLLACVLTATCIAVQLFISDYKVDIVNGSLFVVGMYEFLQGLLFLRAEGGDDACYED